MKRFGFNQHNDQRIADEAGEDRALMCAAERCPCRWTVDAGNGRMCSAHAWVDASQWPRITERLLDADLERAHRGTPPVRPVVLTREQRIAAVAKLKNLNNPSAGRGWAHALKSREEAGECLTLAQRESWRAALGPERAGEEP